MRKTRPKIETPFRCYIYCTNGKFEPHEHLRGNLHYDDSVLMVCDGKGKVIGEFVCDEVMPVVGVGFTSQKGIEYCLRRSDWSVKEFDYAAACFSPETLKQYLTGKGSGYSWHISDLKIYDEPKELSEFAIADKEAIRQCKYREQSYYSFTDTGHIKNGFYCKVKDDWCFGGCKRKALTRPPQSWCYVEELR